MKTVISVLTAHFFVLSAFIWLASPACADSGSDYKAGSDFAKQVQSNGLNSLTIALHLFRKIRTSFIVASTVSTGGGCQPDKGAQDKKMRSQYGK
ncbi:hypothetical protein, partial [Klebsiella pneumoniae]|uniref:hypothetical protein n=1 Tax=Klebsiella pneumoniae TaxID=573 RepID=UPI00211AF878